MKTLKKSPNRLAVRIFRTTFAIKATIMKKRKEYPTIEEDGMIAAEPAMAYATRRTMPCISERMPFNYPKDYDPGIGPYNMKELNARIDKTEHDRNNPDKWIHVDDFWNAMRKEHLWLQ